MRTEILLSPHNQNVTSSLLIFLESSHVLRNKQTNKQKTAIILNFIPNQ